MNTIPTEYTKNGWTYHFVWREGDYAIYEQKGESRSWFELVHIRTRAERKFGETVIPAGEYMPGDAEWGTHGWTFQTLEQAEIALEQKNAAKANPTHVSTP